MIGKSLPLLPWMAALLLLCGQAEAQLKDRLPELIRFAAYEEMEGAPLRLYAYDRQGKNNDVRPFLESARFTVFDSDGRVIPVTFRPLMSFQDTSTGTRNRTRRWSWFSLDHLPAGAYRVEVNYRLRGVESGLSAETQLEIFGAEDIPDHWGDVSQIRARAEIELLAEMGALPQAEMRALELLRSRPDLHTLCWHLSHVYWEVGLLDRALSFLDEYLLYYKDDYLRSASIVPSAYSNLVQQLGLAKSDEEGNDLLTSRVEDILAGRTQSGLTPEMLTPVLGGDLLAARAKEEFARRNRFRLIVVALSSFLAGVAAVSASARLAAAGRKRACPSGERNQA